MDVRCRAAELELGKNRKATRRLADRQRDVLTRDAKSGGSG
jgi:hypothetical protein